ncbi:MAG: transglycosylase SLT domain-containing protein [Bacteroidota bacterium]
MNPRLFALTLFFLAHSLLFSQSKLLSEEGFAANTRGAVSTTLNGNPIGESIDQFAQQYRFEKPTSTRLDTLLYNTNHFRATDVPRYSQSTIRARLYDLPTVIPMDYNVYVQRYIDAYSVQKRDQVARMLGLSRVYFPLFEEELDKKGMPMELKYLSVVESALNPHARSRVGATGLWQFMLSTARLYGMRIDSYVDERKDPLKSTQAALKYLKNAREEFGDWLLAIAAYNCGPGNVRKAIARSGGKRNFWEIREYLPRETRGYVPAFIAATYVFEHASDHNIYPVFVDFSIYQDTLHLNKLDITLKEIADMSGTDVHVLKNLNPELKLDRIPYTSRPYVLKVPRKTAEYFAANERSIRARYGHKRNQYIAPVASKSTTAGRSSSRRRTSSAPRGKKLVYYTVRTGDAVSTIAEKFGVSSRSIAQWNNLRRYRIKTGQKPKIYTNPNRASTSTKKTSSRSTTRQSGSGTYHTIRNGETLWGIANKYPGVSVESIRSLNRGLNAKDLKVGQQIRIR